MNLIKLLSMTFALGLIFSSCKPAKTDSSDIMSAEVKRSPNFLSKFIETTLVKARLDPKQMQVLNDMIPQLTSRLEQTFQNGTEQIVSKTLDLAIPQIAKARKVPESSLRDAVEGNLATILKQNKDSKRLIAWGELGFRSSEVEAIIAAAAPDASQATRSVLFGDNGLSDGIALTNKSEGPANPPSGGLATDSPGQPGEIADMGMYSDRDHLRTWRAQDAQKIFVASLIISGLVAFGVNPLLGGGMILTGVLVSCVTVQVNL